MNWWTTTPNKPKETLQPSIKKEEAKESAEEEETTTSEEETQTNEKPRRKMERCRHPAPLRFDGNVAAEWDRFIDDFEVFALATKLQEEKDTKVQQATFLNIAGPEAQRIFKTLTIDSNETDTLKAAVAAFAAYCKPKANEIFATFQFHKREQREGEPFDKFLTDLKLLAKDCNFGTMEERIIRDKIVIGIRSDSGRTNLLRKSSLTLKDAVDYCRAMESSAAQSKVITGESQEHCLKMVAKPFKTRNKFNERKPGIKETEVGLFDCKCCGRRHERRKCPAYGKTCHKCKKGNHFASQCRSKTEGKQTSKMDIQLKKIYEADNVQKTVEAKANEPSENSIRLNVQNIVADRDKWSETVSVFGNKLNVVIDTGSKTNIIGETVLNKLRIPVEKKKLKTKIDLLSYFGQKQRPTHKVSLPIKYKNNETMIDFLVIEGNRKTLMSGNTAEKLLLIKRLFNVTAENKATPNQLHKPAANNPAGKVASIIANDRVLQKFKDVFIGMGTLPGTTHIEIDTSVSPIIMPVRRVPYAIRDQFKQELRVMEEQGIIEKVSKPTEWVNTFTIVRKPNKLRICLDPHRLNKAIKTPKYPIPNFDTILSKVKVGVG
ncbi:hypothetical protein B4U80_10480 [Leptotrombidium deliense]|uniref:Uncharacterized protein n=1 Tax=Leptotrombidium deliense TaxID=299467 RepID=A0A443S9T9_9ACAR|nr:hypothetical protein B4U80_10480 [Leptotrombidium deliense]